MAHSYLEIVLPFSDLCLHPRARVFSVREQHDNFADLGDIRAKKDMIHAMKAPNAERPYIIHSATADAGMQSACEGKAVGEVSDYDNGKPWQKTQDDLDAVLTVNGVTYPAYAENEKTAADDVVLLADFVKTITDENGNISYDITDWAPFLSQLTLEQMSELQRDGGFQITFPNMDVFRNEVFATLEKVVNRLCETIRHLSKNTIISITRRQWMRCIFNWK